MYMSTDSIDNMDQKVGNQTSTSFQIQREFVSATGIILVLLFFLKSNILRKILCVITYTLEKCSLTAFRHFLDCFEILFK